MQTETLTASPSLDARTCEALGIEEKRMRCPCGDPDCKGIRIGYPRVSTDAGECWRLLVPALQARGWRITVHDTGEGEWFCRLDVPGGDPTARLRGNAPTMSEAICLAALRAAEKE